MAGGVIGAGFQYAFGNGLSAGVEYLYTRYGSADFSGGVTANGIPVPGGVAVDQSGLSSQAVRFVANYKFNDALTSRCNSRMANLTTGPDFMPD